jgi:hypothetical protein
MIADSTGMENVTFELLPIHGDSDIYLSRSEYTKNEKGLSLEGTYYVGVYGYTYATFGVLVTIKRENHTKTENLKLKTT